MNVKLTFYKLKNQLDTFCQYDNHKRGGILQLSSKFPIRKRQIRDIKAANKGLLAQKTWLDENSSLKGDWRLPQDTIFENSQIEIDSPQATILNYSKFKDTKLQAKNAQVLVSNSSFNKSCLELTNADIIITDSKLDHINDINMDSNQFFRKANVKNKRLTHDVLEDGQDKQKVKGPEIEF